MEWQPEYLDDVHREWVERDDPPPELELEVLIWIESTLKLDPIVAASRMEGDGSRFVMCAGQAASDPEVWLAYALDFETRVLGALWLGDPLPDL